MTTMILAMSFDSKIALISAIAALLSALYAFRSNSIAKKALRITERQFLENQPDFDTYYNEGFRFIAENNSSIKKLLLFHITVRNKSAFKNSLKASLRIEYLRDDDSLARMDIEHNSKHKDFLKSKDLSVFPIDIELDAKTTTTKWLIFEQPSFLNSSHRIEKYEIRFSDLKENKSIIEAVLIKDLDK